MSNNTNYNLPPNAHIRNNNFFIDDICYKNEDTLKILYLNARSIRNKIDDLAEMLDNIKHTIHLIVISETWIPDDEEDFFHVRNYQKPLLSCRNRRRGGGAGIFVHNSLKYTAKETYCDNVNSIVSLKTENLHDNFYISAVYRPPETSTMHVSRFLEKLDNHLDKLKSRKSILIGDFNFNLKNSSNVDIQTYKTTVESNGYFSCHEEITRPAAGTCLDHVLVGNPASEINITFFQHDFSEHLGFVIELENSKIQNKSVSSNQLIYKKIKYDHIKEELKNCVINATDVDSFANELSIKCKNAINSATVLKSANCTKNKYSAPWIDKQCSELIQKKNYWYKKFMQNQNSVVLKEKYKFWLNKTTMIKRKKREEYDKLQFAKANNDPKKNWQYIKQLIGYSDKKVNTFFINCVDKQNKIEKLNAFNKYYAEIGENLAKNFNTTYFPKIKLRKQFKFQKITRYECSKLISDLSNTNASGNDKISATIAKYCKKELVVFFTELINKSLSQNKMPKCLKINKVIPIPKKAVLSNNANVDDFRPISISSLLSKIIETVVNKQLTDYLYAANLIPKKQYGFKKKSSTQAALFDLVSCIHAGHDNNKKVAAVFFDVKKAFDTVDRNTLLKILIEHGVKGPEYRWFKSYLSDRQQYSECEDNQSEITTINYGVIQGSSLGPTLFSIYISSLLDLKLNGKPYMFADDLAIVYIRDTCDQLEDAINEDMIVIKTWMDHHKVSVNSNKTKLIIFRRKPADYLEILYDNNLLEMVRYYKYLGVIVDENLSWIQQIAEQIKKGRKVAGIFKLINRRVPQQLKRTLYYSMFHSTVTYNIQIWGNAYDKYLKLLQTVQNKAIKNLFGYDIRTATRKIHKNHNILPLNLYIKSKLAMHVYLMVTKNINTNVQPIMNNEVHTYTTRTANNIRIQSSAVRFNNCDSVYNEAYKAFNGLPDELKNIDRVNVFRRTLNEYFLGLI